MDFVVENTYMNLNIFIVISEFCFVISNGITFSNEDTKTL